MNRVKSVGAQRIDNMHATVRACAKIYKQESIQKPTETFAKRVHDEHDTQEVSEEKWLIHHLLVIKKKVNRLTGGPRACHVIHSFSHRSLTTSTEIFHSFFLGGGVEGKIRVLQGESKDNEDNDDNDETTKRLRSIVSFLFLKFDR